MSDTFWALQMMTKYRLNVDFSLNEISCRGFNQVWCWDCKSGRITFYDALQQAVIDIERNS